MPDSTPSNPINIEKAPARSLVERLRDLSIRTKLLLLATTSVAVALALAFAGMAANDISFIRKSKVEQLYSQAQMLAFNSSGVLAFDDVQAGEELLASLSMYPYVEYAILLDEDGDVFAEYKKSNISTPDLKGHASGVRIGDGIVEVLQEVSDGNARIGSVYIRTNMSDIYAHIRRYLIIVSAIMVSSLMAAALLTLYLQNTISTPINSLANATRLIRDNKDYSVRVPSTSNDELGQLSVTFNAMLDEIESSKAALQKAHDKLEDQVAERTQQLREEIEQRKVIQVALEHARDDAEAASRAKSEFLANMSHEIRTPLNGILGFTELLMHQNSEIDKATQNDYLETIAKSGDHLLTLINDILDLSKIEAGQMEIERCPVSPHDVINQVVSVLRARAHQKGLTLLCDWKSSVPESIMTDGGRLRQLLMNLIGNAIKFTNEGTVSVEASLCKVTDTMSINVIDTGIGIAQHKLSDIFDPFVQADNSVTRQYGGTGLGLAISKRIAKALGGSIHVESEEGKGSKFTLRISTGTLEGVPLLKPPTADAFVGDSLSTNVEKSEATPKLPNCKILLVEDGQVNRKLVQIMLEEAGAQVETAENGWVGFQLASRRAFDLVLMDMQMPVMDGYTATKKLREAGVRIPILALTAHAMKGDDEKCLHAGCSAYLTKPIQVSHLVRTVAKYLPKTLCSELTPASENSSSSELTTEFTKETSMAVSNTNERNRYISTLPLNNPVYQEIVNEFVDTLEGHVQDMKRAYESGDFQNLGRLAHGLKGAGGTAGFDVLLEPTSTLQKCGEEIELENIEQALNDLTFYVQQICETPQKREEPTSAPKFI